MSSPSRPHPLDNAPPATAGDGASAPRGWAIASLLGALASLSCCVVPLLLFTLGVSGAWIAKLTALAPYQPLLLVFALGCLGMGFQRVYRRPRVVCAEGSYCARPASRRLVKTALWAATGLVAIALVYPVVAPVLLGL